MWRVLCMSNIDKTLVTFLFQVNSKTAFQVNFWLMGLYLPARLHTSLDLREAACRFTANKVLSLHHRETLNFPPSMWKTADISIVLHHISEGSSPFIAGQFFPIIQWYIARSKERGQKACSKTKERFIPLQTSDPLLHPLKTFHPPSLGSVLRPS